MKPSKRANKKLKEFEESSARSQPRRRGTQLGRKLRKLRKRKGVGLRELAARVGISPSYLSNIERGKFAPPAEDTLRAIARELDQDPYKLMALAGKIPIDPTCGTGSILIAAFGDLLRSLREQKGVALKELAAKVGMSAPYLCNIERGNFPPPSEEKLCSIAHELGQDSDELLAKAGKVRSDLPKIIERHPRQYAVLLRSMRNLDESDFRVLFDGLAQQFDIVLADPPYAARGEAHKERTHVRSRIDWKLLS
jgi:transcriptional regulator with XRE-family HTH domain